MAHRCGVIICGEKYCFETYHTLPLIGSHQTIQFLKHCVNLLKDKDGNEYNRLLKFKPTIFITSVKNFDNELFLKEKIWFANRFIAYWKKSSVYWVTSLLVHEVHHLWQFTRGKVSMNDATHVRDKAEQLACKRQRRFLKKLGRMKEVAWLDKLIKEQYWKGDEDDEKIHLRFKAILEDLRFKGFLQLI